MKAISVESNFSWYRKYWKQDELFQKTAPDIGNLTFFEQNLSGYPIAPPPRGDVVGGAGASQLGGYATTTVLLLVALVSLGNFLSVFSSYSTTTTTWYSAHWCVLSLLFSVNCHGLIDCVYLSEVENWWTNLTPILVPISVWMGIL